MNIPNEVCQLGMDAWNNTLGTPYTRYAAIYRAMDAALTSAKAQPVAEPIEWPRIYLNTDKTTYVETDSNGYMHLYSHGDLVRALSTEEQNIAEQSFTTGYEMHPPSAPVEGVCVPVVPVAWIRKFNGKFSQSYDNEERALRDLAEYNFGDPESTNMRTVVARYECPPGHYLVAIPNETAVPQIAATQPHSGAGERESKPAWVVCRPDGSLLLYTVELTEHMAWMRQTVGGPESIVDDLKSRGYTCEQIEIRKQSSPASEAKS